MSEGFITNGDVQIAFRDSGTAGRDVVLSHGVFANLEYFAPLAGRLADEYRLVSYDLRGHGQSGTGPSSLRDHGDDLLALIEQLELDRPFVIGVSYGAFVALEVAVPDTIGRRRSREHRRPARRSRRRCQWSPDHPSWSERRESFRASIAKRPDQWSGSRDELAARLSDVPEGSRAFETRKYVEDGRGSYVQRPDPDTAADLVMTGRCPGRALLRAPFSASPRPRRRAERSSLQRCCAAPSRCEAPDRSTSSARRAHHRGWSRPRRRQPR